MRARAGQLARVDNYWQYQPDKQAREMRGALFSARRARSLPVARRIDYRLHALSFSVSARDFRCSLVVVVGRSKISAATKVSSGCLRNSAKGILSKEEKRISLACENGAAERDHFESPNQAEITNIHARRECLCRARRRLPD